VDRQPEGIRRLAGEHPGLVADHVADVADPVAVETVVDAVECGLGPVGILVNVAGVLHTGPVVDCADAAWAETFSVNAGGVFHTCRAVARRMVPRSAGSIVTVASNAAGVPRAGMAAYAASKAAATVFTKCLGLELAGHGIRCNVVAPGSTDTAMQRATWTDGRADPVITGDLGTYRTGIPLGRIASPQDIADAVLFLLSDQARHITMHNLYVDGGATLRA
jgi:2,3-dihydro-2,3-dihydroxybenzoate dehydrogenase